MRHELVPNHGAPASAAEASRRQSLRPVRWVAELLSLLWLSFVKRAVFLCSEKFHFFLSAFAAPSSGASQRQEHFCCGGSC